MSSGTEGHIESARVKRFLQENQVKYILAQFVDVHGVAKTKAVPANHVEELLTAGAGFAGFAVWGLGMEPHSPDFMAVGDPSTLTMVPWQAGYARMACIGHVNGQPYPFDSRVILIRQIEELRAKGFLLNTGIEPEFCLLSRHPDGSIRPFDGSDKLEKPCYDYKGMARSSEFLDRLVSALAAVGFDIYQVDHEDANGQFEINYTYSDCLQSADRFVFFKMAASEIANQMGFICSFMPKPFANRAGSGLHFHLSLCHSQQGSDLFQDDADQRGLGLSRLAYHFAAGLMAHAGALCAICAPTVNSYKRLVVGRSLSGATWAPAYVCYGRNNRSAMVRVPYGRLELRLPDGSANPYLVTAAIIAAGMDGVRRELDPGDPANVNIYEAAPERLREMGIRTLPQNLGEALDRLEGDEVLQTALGREFSAEFINLKRMEWVEYQRHVSDWELARYVEFF